MSVTRRPPSDERECLTQALREKDWRGALLLGAVVMATLALRGKRLARRVRQRLVGFVALIVVACGGLALPGGWAHTPTLYVTPELAKYSPEFTEALVTASKDWCRQGFRCVDVDIGRGANEARLALDVDHADFNDPSAVSRGSIAVTSHKGTKRVIFLLKRGPYGPVLFSNAERACNGRTVFDALTVARHEFGHFLGIDEHSEDRANIMYPASLCGLTDPVYPKP